MKYFSHRLALCVLPVLAACSSINLPSTASLGFSPYRIDVRQGNYVSQDMVSQLKKGMSKDQVRFALGTPLLKDVFHKERWDYVYLFEPAKGPKEERRISVLFDDNGRLKAVTGDVVAASNGAPNVPTPSQQIVEITTPAEPGR